MNATDTIATPTPTGQLALSRSKALVFSAIVTIGFLLAVELAVRGGAYVIYGFSPYYFFYGTRAAMSEATPDPQTIGFEGYFKFRPSRLLHQYGVFTTPTPIRINSLGFRGPDFTPDKPAGTFRIISLGESSTFGYFNRDDYTYPAILGRLFKERVPTRAVEVVNAGIPNSNSDHRLAMLRAEIFRYNPDVITIYTGYNDAMYLQDETVLQALARWVHAHSVTYVALKRALTALGGPALHSRWASFLPRADRAHVERQTRLHVDAYRRTLREIVSLARSHGTQVVLIKQPMTTLKYGQPREPPMTYQQELASIRNQLQEHGWVTAAQALFLVHHALMNTLEEVASRDSIPLVDNIAIVEKHPEYLASYVHLTEEGNAVLAEVLFRTLLPGP